MSRKVLAAALVAGLWTSAAMAAFGPNYKVFPNPVRVDQGQRVARFDDLVGGGELKIFNAAGRLVLEKTIDASATFFEWDLRNGDSKEVAAGIYVYYLKSGGESRTGKIGIIR